MENKPTPLISPRPVARESLEVNAVLLSGRVVRIRHYQDNNDMRTIAILRNGQGSFYVELVGHWDLCEQDLVLVTGNVYSKFVRNRQQVGFHAKQVSLLARERPCERTVG
ncbi:MAG: hypothetical protein ACOYYS_10805 [Chloroflexota bacterium]